MVRTPPPPPKEDPYDKVLEEYILTDPLTRLDILTCTREISGLLFLSDDHVSTLTNLRIQRIGKDSKELQGTTGSPPHHLVWRCDVMKVVANICSYYDIIDGKDELPEMVDTGHEVKRVINGNKKKQEAVENLTKNLFPPNAIPKNDKDDIIPFYLPVAIPLFQNHGIFDGHKDDSNLLNILHENHPVLSLWLHSITSGRSLLPNFLATSISVIVQGQL